MRSRLPAFAVIGAAALAIAIIAAIVFDGDEAESPAVVETPAGGQTPAAATSPTPGAFEPAFAPDGRTGIAELDRIIDEFVGMTAVELTTAYAAVAAREYVDERDNILPPAEWAARLVAGSRALFSVVREEGGSGIVPPRQFNVFLRVTGPDGDDVLWALAVERGTVVDLAIGGEPYTGDVGFNHERFLVLPPRAELPQAPPAHPLSTRTGVAGVDSLLAMLEGQDSARLAAAAVMPTAFSRCRIDQPERQDVATRRLGEVAQQAIAIHAVAVPPAGHLPAADHMLIVLLEPSPYLWSTAALLERSGAVVGFDLCEVSQPEFLYPPQAYPLPPAAALANLDPARRSGIGSIDAFLDAMAAADLKVMLGLIDYQQVGCITEPVGIGGPPFCEAEEPEGTLLDVIAVASCEGHYIRRESMPQILSDLSGKSWSLYSVVQPGPPTDASFTPGKLQAILVDVAAPADSFQRLLSPWFTDSGLSGLFFACGQRQPGDLEVPGTAPAFLLPPP